MHSSSTNFSTWVKMCQRHASEIESVFLTMSNVFLALSLTWPLAINGIFSLALVWLLEPTSKSSEACSFCSILYGTDMGMDVQVDGRDIGEMDATATCRRTLHGALV